MALTDQTKVENYLKRALTAREAAILSLVISAVTKHMEKRIGFTIEGNTSGEQTFVAARGRYLFLNTIVRDITKVELLNDDGTVLDELESGTEYLAHPQTGTQKRYIELISGDWLSGTPNWAQRQLVKITGKFAWGTSAPEDLSLAATIWVAEILSNPQKLKSESIEGYSRQYREIEDEHPEITMTLNSYGAGNPML